MATEILAAGTTEASSADVIVAAGAPVNVMLFRDDEAKVEAGCTCPIFKIDSDGNWNPTTWSLNRDSPTRILVGAGTYQIRRYANISYATGIASD